MFSIKRPFPGQKPDERVIMFTRRHWLSFLGFLGLVLGMVLVLAVFLVILAILLPDVFLSFRSPLILIASAYLLFSLAFFLVGWIDYYFDIVIITDRRIIDIRQKGLFSRKIDELDILHVEDVSAQVRGVLPTFFHYGNVYVQTAGAARNFLFQSLPHPQNICRLIMNLYDKILAQQSEKANFVDHAEGLGRRHIHPSLEEISGQGDFSRPQLPPQSSKNIPKLEKRNLDGEITEGEEVDFHNGPPKY
jgi:hypothetical protein